MTNQATTIKFQDIQTGNVFGDAFGENEYTVISKEFCQVWRKNIVWVRDLDGETRGLNVEQINDIIKFDDWAGRAGFYNA